MRRVRTGDGRGAGRVRAVYGGRPPKLLKVPHMGWNAISWGARGAANRIERGVCLFCALVSCEAREGRRDRGDGGLWRAVCRGDLEGKCDDAVSSGEEPGCGCGHFEKLRGAGDVSTKRPGHEGPRRRRNSFFGLEFMGVELIPAIDLRNGQVVRLRRGDYSQQTVYEVDPVDIAKSFEDAGCTWLHVVDLDGAKEGKPVNLGIVEKIVRATKLRVEVGAGFDFMEPMEYTWTLEND